MKMTLDFAESAIHAAVEKAKKTGVPVNIVVLDDGGYLKAFARMDGAVLGSIDIAMKKAKTSILFGMNSEGVWEFCKPGAPGHGLEMTNETLVTFAGGIPYRDDEGNVIGAIGVSGGSVAQDYSIAEAGSLISQNNAA